jgi:hypothetical protein
MRVLIVITFLIGSLTLSIAFARSQAELDQACEAARAEKLAPLRQQKIKECKADSKNDPKWCEQYWSDYGDGGKNGPHVIQRMYDNLPECVKAEKARRDVN